MSTACKRQIQDPGGPSSVAEACAVETALYATADVIRLDVEGCAGIEIDRWVVHGDGEHRLEMYTDGRQLVVKVVAVTDGVFRGLQMQGTWWAAGDDDPALWRLGHHSGSSSAVAPIGGISLDSDGLPEVGGGPGDGDVEPSSNSWWAGLAGRPGGGAVLAGTLSARQLETWVAFGEEDVHVVWGGRRGAIPLEAGQYFFLDPIWLGVGSDPDAVWTAWAEAVANDAQPPPPSTPPVGWMPAYAPPDALHEDDVRANLAAAVALDVELVSISEGWAVAWGDWRPNGRFPSGLAALADEIRGEGRVPGIWMAPFLVQPDAAIHRAHEDWWVLDDDGAQLRVEGRAVLDVTHPDAADWLASQIEARLDEGFDALHLDVLYAGAVDGARHEPFTGAQAYQIGMAILREAAGDAWLFAGGAPMLPSVGFADVWRSGPTGDAATLRGRVGSTAASGFANGLWWWNDPGPLRIAEGEATGGVVGNAIAGGAWFLGDDLVALSEARRALAVHPDVLQGRGQRARPLDPLRWAGGVPPRWAFDDGTMALINVGDAPLELSSPGGVELLTGSQADAGRRTLQPGEGELWR